MNEESRLIIWKWGSNTPISLVPFRGQFDDRTMIRRLTPSIRNYRWCPICREWIQPGQPMLMNSGRLLNPCASHFWEEYREVKLQR